MLKQIKKAVDSSILGYLKHSWYVLLSQCDFFRILYIVLRILWWPNTCTTGWQLPLLDLCNLFYQSSERQPEKVYRSLPTGEHQVGGEIFYFLTVWSSLEAKLSDNYDISNSLYTVAPVPFNSCDCELFSLCKGDVFLYVRWYLSSFRWHKSTLSLLHLIQCLTSFLLQMSYIKVLPCYFNWY
jgi:hypothetical protein